MAQPVVDGRPNQLGSITYTDFFQTYFTKEKGISTLSKVISVAGEWLKIFNPALAAMGDAFKTVGGITQNFCKMARFPESVTKTLCNFMNTFIIPDGAILQVEGGADERVCVIAFRTDRAWHFFIETIHSTADMLSKAKGVLSILDFCNIEVIAKAAFKRICIAADVFLLTSATWKSGEHVYTLVTTSVPDAVLKKRLIDLAFQITLIAFASIGLAVTFGGIVLSNFTMPALLTTHILLAITKDWMDTQVPIAAG